METNVVIDGCLYTFRDPTKKEMDEWERKYKINLLQMTLYSVAEDIRRIWEKAENNQIRLEIAERITESKQKILERWIKENYGTTDEGLITSEAQAEKMAMCIVKPKKTKEEWRNIPYNLFTLISIELDRFLEREMTSDFYALQRFREILSSYPKEVIEIKEVLKLLDEVTSLNIKKN